jgi:DNA-binding transcriptional ArsR family regulator
VSDGVTAHKPLTEIDRVIHEPARLVICALLAGVSQADFLFVQNETGLTKGNLSSHLATLEKNGYVDIEKTYRGKRPLTLLSLTEAGRSALVEYRSMMGDLIDTIGESE